MINEAKRSTDRRPVSNVTRVEPAASAGTEFVCTDAHLDFGGLERLERGTRVRFILVVAGRDNRPAQADLAAVVARNLESHLWHVDKPRLHTGEWPANMTCAQANIDHLNLLYSLVYE